jgi:Fe-S-cluster containining protein
MTKIPPGYIELKQRCTTQMRLDICSGCDKCGLRCANDVPCSAEEWAELQAYIAAMTPEDKQELERVMAQDKTVDLGDEVTVELCQYRDMEAGRCMVYPARPLVCRLLGHVEWMPCPIEAVPTRIRTSDALELMQSYAQFERRRFADWESPA